MMTGQRFPVQLPLAQQVLEISNTAGWNIKSSHTLKSNSFQHTWKNGRGCELCGATLRGQTQQIIDFKKAKSKVKIKGANTMAIEKKKKDFSEGPV